MSISELCTDFISSKKLKDETERNIIEFAEAPWGLGLGTVDGVPPLYPVQKFIFKCYYNIPLNNTDRNIIINDHFNEKELYRFTELDYLNYLWNEGRVNVKEVDGDPKKTRPNLLLVVGRRGFKTSSIAIISAYETYKLLKKISPQHYYHLMPDDEIRISCIATNQEQASQLFRNIAGHLERSEYFKKYRNKPTLNYMQLSSQRDIETYGQNARPSIRIVASPCSGRGLRGHNNIIVIMDEMAHFFESETSFDKSDENIYEAVTPSVANFNGPNNEPHGRIISISSPGDHSGKFWQLHERAREKDCNDLLMIQAPTWEVNNTLSSKYLRSKFAENPLTFGSEFGAQFSDRVTAWIENEQLLRMNIVPGLKLKTMSYERVPHFMGIDIGLKQDGTAISVCHVVKKESEGGLKDFIELDFLDVRYAEAEGKEYFQPDEMAEWIKTVAEKFFIVKGVMDQYYGLAIVPILHAAGLKQIESQHVSREYSSRVFQNLMAKMLDGSLRIPEDDEHIKDGKKTKDLDLISEMLRLQATVHSKYLITVGAPEIKGQHDDLSDAFARSILLATEFMASGAQIQNKTAEAASRAGSYKQYYLKQKRNAAFTMRPSSGLQIEMARNKNYSRYSPLGSRRG